MGKAGACARIWLWRILARNRSSEMSAPDKRLPFGLAVSKQEDCLRELKDAGASPIHMIMYGLLNFTMPSMFRYLMVAVVSLGAAYFGFPGA
jgi:hypothetical protein